MLIAIPVCEKDVELVLKNLAWLDKLGAPYNHPALVTHDDKFNAAEVVSEAKKRFKDVSVCRYSKWTGEQRWPVVENYAWQQTARFIEAQKLGPWLWWEADATPLKENWPDILQAEYTAAGKPFMGFIVGPDDHPLGDGHMNGVACYPQDVSQYTVEALLCRSVPFDIMLREVTRSRAHRANHLIKWTPTAITFTARDQVESICGDAVIVHKCKDGSAIDCLSGFNLMAWLKKKPKSNITVVITNFRRHHFLWDAFQSCLSAGIQNIVITSSEASTAVKKVHASIRSFWPDTVIVSEDVDSGSNENWLRGVAAAKTEWVQILHDDDRLTPDYSDVETVLGAADFLCWDGTTHGDVNGQSVVTFPDINDGVHPTSLMEPRLINRRLSPSPVAGLFRKEHLIGTLKECRSWGKEFYYKNKLLVGNDFLIWLNAVRRYSDFCYIKEPLISYGNHGGSATCQSIRSGDNQLERIYNKTKEYWKANDRSSKRNLVCH